MMWNNGGNALRGLQGQQTNISAFNRFFFFVLYPVAVHSVLIFQGKIYWLGTDSKQ